MIKTRSQHASVQSLAKKICAEYTSTGQTCRIEIVVHHVLHNIAPGAECSDAECVAISRVKNGVR